MGRARYLVEAVVLEGRSPTRLAREHGISRSWLFELFARYRQGGNPALEPRSRRPKSSPQQVSAEVVAEVLKLRQELAGAGFDAGAQTILFHLQDRFPQLPSAATIWRILKRQGQITPQPHKRPKSSFVRFEAQLPNQTWQCCLTRPSTGAARQLPRALQPAPSSPRSGTACTPGRLQRTAQS